MENSNINPTNSTNFINQTSFSVHSTTSRSRFIQEDDERALTIFQNMYRSGNSSSNTRSLAKSEGNDNIDSSDENQKSKGIKTGDSVAQATEFKMLRLSKSSNNNSRKRKKTTSIESEKNNNNIDTNSKRPKKRKTQMSNPVDLGQPIPFIPQIPPVSLTLPPAPIEAQLSAPGQQTTTNPQNSLAAISKTKSRKLKQENIKLLSEIQQKDAKIKKLNARIRKSKTEFQKLKDKHKELNDVSISLKSRKQRIENIRMTESALNDIKEVISHYLSTGESMPFTQKTSTNKLAWYFTYAKLPLFKKPIQEDITEFSEKKLKELEGRLLTDDQISNLDVQISNLKDEVKTRWISTISCHLVAVIQLIETRNDFPNIDITAHIINILEDTRPKLLSEISEPVQLIQNRFSQSGVLPELPELESKSSENPNQKGFLG